MGLPKAPPRDQWSRLCTFGSVAPMVQATGCHAVKSGYGQWLPGDDRGSWSQAWDEQIGYLEPHTLHAGDSVRKRMAQERMNHPAVRLTDAMLEAIEDAIGSCVATANGGLSIAQRRSKPRTCTS